jgi:DNA-binding MarR family transcriptional regulator
MNEPDSPCGSASRTLLMSLLHAGGVVEDRLERSLEPWGLSMAKMGALHHLSAAGQPIALGQLADRLSCVKSNVTQLVDRLEADGLARRLPDPADRRSILATITDEGRRRFAAAAQAQAGVEAEILALLPEDDLAKLGELLGRLTGAHP